jgi:lipoate---protein ligase
VSAAGWEVVHHRGDAATFHGRDLPDPARRSVWLLEVDRPALVLGSSQPDAHVDLRAAARAGVEVVRRRSGGGAVLLVPGEVLWVDLVIPASDPLWDDDVSRAFHWVGSAWVAALEALGVAATAHSGPMLRSAWSSRVCFAGLGPGEVTVGGAKLVGVSQRRSRAGARFQCAVHRSWQPGALLDLLSLGAAEREAAAVALGSVATGAPRPLADVARSLLDNLPETAR